MSSVIGELKLTKNPSQQALTNTSSSKREAIEEHLIPSKKRRVSNVYILWALLAAFTMALTSYLRTIVSDTPFTSFFVLSLSYLIVSVITLSVLKWRLKDEFHMSWSQKTPSDSLPVKKVPTEEQISREEWQFSSDQFTLVCLGGVAEFGTSLFSILAFNQATQGGINAGTAGVLIPLSGIFVSFASYFIFKEKLQAMQVAGLVTIVAGATVIAMFPAQDAESGDKVTTSEVLKVLVFSMLATLSLSFELVLSKILAHKGVDGKYIGFNFLLAEGALGCLGLVVMTVCGSGLYAIDSQSFWLMMLAGLSGVLSVSLLQFSISIGIAGVVSSIFNTNVSFFSALCFFFLDQALTVWQAVGIAVTIVGAVCLSIDDDSVLRCCGCSRKQKSCDSEGSDGYDDSDQVSEGVTQLTEPS